MTPRTVSTSIWALALAVASCGSAERDAATANDAWRAWFQNRQFGEDPYFFFPSNTAGPTGCPENRRLTFSGADSLGANLLVIDERGSTPEVRARCSVRFDELQGSPQVKALPDGRAMWALSAQDSRSAPLGRE